MKLVAIDEGVLVDVVVVVVIIDVRCHRRRRFQVKTKNKKIIGQQQCDDGETCDDFHTKATC